MSLYHYNITKTEKGILIDDYFFDDLVDGFVACYRDRPQETNLGRLSFETIELVYREGHIYQYIILNLDGDNYYYGDYPEIIYDYHRLAKSSWGTQIKQNTNPNINFAPYPDLPNLKEGGWNQELKRFELLKCFGNYDYPVYFIEDNYN